VRVLQRYGWSHSLHFEKDVAGSYRGTPRDAPWMIHLAEGTDAVLARHQAAARATRAGVRAPGLRLWAADESICADTVTAVRMPPGVSEADVRAVARSESGVMLSGGQGGLPVLQVGHMGPSANPLAPVIAVVALGRALRRAGATADVGAAVEAVLGADSHGAGTG